jgi:hypothetical protein
MDIHQILIRPRDNTVVILYQDIAGTRNTIVYDSSGNATVAALVSDAQSRLPTEQNRPDKAEIQQEIQGLEQRVALLKQSIGQV